MTRCPSCQAFVSVQPYINLVSDWVMCRSCGRRIHVPTVFDVALVSGSRRAETPQEAQGVASLNGPKGNALSPLSNLKPNGKIKKTKLSQSVTDQLFLFGGVA